MVAIAAQTTREGLPRAAKSKNEEDLEINQIFEKIVAWDNLLNAYHHAASEKWFRDDVAAFSARLGKNLLKIQKSLRLKYYKVGSYREFYVYEPKKRLVMALGFPDRVVQWAIYLQLNPILDRQFYFHSYGCRVGKGTARAAAKLQDWVRLTDRKPGTWYYLKLDISKYFYRVDHEVLLSILRQKFPDEPDLMWLMDKIINCEHTAFGLPAGKTVDEIDPEDRLFDVGMPIGNLTSQLMANVCLDQLDQYIKHELHLHYYVRYMDDMVILLDDKVRLNECRILIEKFLNERLHLELNSKTVIGKPKNGITFVGYIIRPGYKKLKRKSLKKMKARMRYIQKAYARGEMDFEKVNATMMSYFGQMQHFNSNGLRKWVAENIVFQREDTETDGELDRDCGETVGNHQDPERRHK